MHVAHLAMHTAKRRRKCIKHYRHLVDCLYKNIDIGEYLLKLFENFVGGLFLNHSLVLYKFMTNCQLVLSCVVQTSVVHAVHCLLADFQNMVMIIMMNALPFHHFAILRVIICVSSHE